MQADEEGGGRSDAAYAAHDVSRHACDYDGATFDGSPSSPASRQNRPGEDAAKPPRHKTACCPGSVLLRRGMRIVCIISAAIWRRSRAVCVAPKLAPPRLPVVWRLRRRTRARGERREDG